MIINHNMNAMNAQRQMSSNMVNSGKSMEKLSSGLRINKAGDDAAGLAISEKMRAQVRGLDQAGRNAQDGISMIQTAEGALNETHSILQRMRELSDQSANGTNTNEDRKAIQDEVTQLKGEIDRIGNTTEFNTQKLLNGNLKSAGGAVVGQNSTVGAAVGKLASASLTGHIIGAASATGAVDSATDFVAEKVKIDGAEITVNWQNLSTDDKNFIKAATASNAGDSNRAKAVELITKTINDAINQSGQNVSQVTGYAKSTGELVIQSQKEGTQSSISVTGKTGVLGQMTNGSTGETKLATGTSKYNGTAIADKSDFDLKIGDITMQASIGAVANGDTMVATATKIQSAINNAIKEYNTKVLGSATHTDAIKDVKVNATDDGRFEIISESGPISFADIKGSTAVKDLGLSQAQTDSSGNGGMTFQIGANKGQTITFGVNDMRSAALGIASVDVSTQAGASNALKTVDKAISSVSSERSKLGAIQNRLEHTIANLGTSSENLTAAESRIRDVDMAKEMMSFSKNNILSQAAQAMLAQANQQPQGVLQLLR